VCIGHVVITRLAYFILRLMGCIYGVYTAYTLYNIIYLQNTLNSKRKIVGICAVYV